MALEQKSTTSPATLVDQGAARLVMSLARDLRRAVHSDDVAPLRSGAVTLALGYEVQEEIARLHRRSGDPVVGFKVGLTTADAQAEWRTDAPGRGHLFRSAVHSSPALVTTSARPLLCEVEVAVVLAVDLDDPFMPEDELLTRIDTVHAAVEIVSSRWSGGAPDVGSWAADNAMATAAILGGPGRGASVLRDVARATSVLDGEVVHADSSTALNNLRWLVRERCEGGEPLSAGSIVLTGSIGKPLSIPADGGRLLASVQGLGEVRVHFDATAPSHG